jgi:uncharacterized protein (DUF1800 family)
MMTNISPTDPLDSISPDVAWRRWEPSADQVWDARRAALLGRRAGFGCTPRELQHWGKRTASEMLDHYLERELWSDSEPSLASVEQDALTLKRAALASNSSQQISGWWLRRMIRSPQQLREKMTLFWHGHFATSIDKVQDVELMVTQNELLRANALESFSTLVHGIAKDPAMLIYLDSVSNRKAHANENFARELMELFCLGEGNYSEADVQELARCFTGWEIRRKQFRFNPYQNDTRSKRLFEKEDVQSGEEAIDCVLRHPALPTFIARKLFHFFISEEYTPSDEFLEPLAAKFRQSGLKIGSIVEAILASNLMLSGWSQGRKIRSPIELVVGWIRCVDCSANSEFVVKGLKALGQSVFEPPNVEGWEGGKTWINSSTLTARANLLYELLRHSNTRFAGLSLMDYFKKNQASDVASFVAWVNEYFLAVPLSTPDTQMLVTSNQDKDLVQWMSRLATNPKVHLA